MVTDDQIVLDVSHEIYGYAHGNMISYSDDSGECELLGDTWHMMFCVSANSDKVEINWAGE